MAIPTGRLQGVAMRRHVACNVKCQRAGVFRSACSSHCEKLRNERELEVNSSPFSPPTIVDDLTYRSPYDGSGFGGPSGDAPFNGGGGGSGGAGASGEWGDAGSCSGGGDSSSSGGGGE